MSEPKCPFTRVYPRLVATENPQELDVLAGMEAWYDHLSVEEPEREHVWQQHKKVARQRLRERGHYDHTEEELVWGAKIAWRNSIRCVGRYFWRELDVIDARNCVTEEAIFQACVKHLIQATNRGNIKSTVTVFAPDQPGQRGPRIWNPQLIRYAGYRNGDGSVLGDPLMLDLTERIIALGWNPPGNRGPFDLLPLVIQLPGKSPVWFSLPQEAVVEVPITHPSLPGFAELGLKWHAVPVISNMALVMGGVRYPCAPFNGWYVETEIGSRDLGDVDRYNQIPVIARLMELDTQSNQNLWRDRALVELNQAVLYSFRKSGVKILDHFTVAELHVKFEEQERASGRPVTGLWSWLVSPLSGSASPLWPRSYKETQYLPAFLYPDDIKQFGMGNETA